MAKTSLDLRRRIVEAFQTGRTKSYDHTAEMFGVGRATVSRLLRLKRETGDVVPLPHRSNNPRRVDLGWIEQHARAHPDARLVDRVAAWEAHSGKKVSITAIWGALGAIGWTHKKSRWSPSKEIARTSKSDAATSSRSNRTSTRRG